MCALHAVRCELAATGTGAPWVGVVKSSADADMGLAVDAAGLYACGPPDRYTGSVTATCSRNGDSAAGTLTLDNDCLDGEGCAGLVWGHCCCWHAALLIQCLLTNSL
jgi:hypothetical protein